MSTKIYHGYKYTKPNNKTINLFELSDQIKETLEPVVYNKQLDTTRKLKELHNNPNKTFMMSMLDIYKEVSNSNYRSPTLDYKTSIVLLNDPETNTKTVLLLLYTEHKEVHEALKTIPGIKHYPYWDNTDKDKNVTQEEWEERRKTWERTVGNDAPAHKGLNLELEDKSIEITLKVTKEKPNKPPKQTH